ncbi:transmembrane protein 150A [Centroberyx affinis]|uniref:transmembrane protein 150A n=1 Tax=Centroberyx affinis TaxID=166261 RepID=UPI003A5BB5A9
MVFWILLPISLALLSLVGTWTVYGLAFYFEHVCSLSNWEGDNFCRGNESIGCCKVPTISSSGTRSPENSLFSATISAGSFLFLVFSIFHHAHILEKNAAQSMLSKFALVFGEVAAIGAFAAGNCNPGYLSLLHNLGAALSFLCICFYTVLLTALTGRCVLTGFEKFLYPIRIVSTVLQIIVTICYTILFAQDEYWYKHLSAVFEWMLSVNLELFELSYAVEFCFFSSSMLSNLLGKPEEEKPLILTMS